MSKNTQEFPTKKDIELLVGKEHKCAAKRAVEASIGGCFGTTLIDAEMGGVITQRGRSYLALGVGRAGVQITIKFCPFCGKKLEGA